jgi:hypothetical protein
MIVVIARQKENKSQCRIRGRDIIENIVVNFDMKYIDCIYLKKYWQGDKQKLETAAGIEHPA